MSYTGSTFKIVHLFLHNYINGGSIFLNFLFEINIQSKFFLRKENSVRFQKTNKLCKTKTCTCNSHVKMYNFPDFLRKSRKSPLTCLLGFQSKNILYHITNVSNIYTFLHSFQNVYFQIGSEKNSKF